MIFHYIEDNCTLSYGCFQELISLEKDILHHISFFASYYFFVWNMIINDYHVVHYEILGHFKLLPHTVHLMYTQLWVCQSHRGNVQLALLLSLSPSLPLFLSLTAIFTKYCRNWRNSVAVDSSTLGNHWTRPGWDIATFVRENGSAVMGREMTRLARKWGRLTLDGEELCVTEGI